MKKIILIISIFISLVSYCQDSSKVYIVSYDARTLVQDNTQPIFTNGYTYAIGHCNMTSITIVRQFNIKEEALNYYKSIIINGYNNTLANGIISNAKIDSTYKTK